MAITATTLRHLALVAAIVVSLPTGLAISGDAATGPSIAGQWTHVSQLAENLVGKPVFTREGNEAGEVEKIMRGENQHVVAIVISVGGVLGLGARSVLVSPEEVDVKREAGRTRLYLDITRKTLDARSEAEGQGVTPNGSVK